MGAAGLSSDVGLVVGWGLAMAAWLGLLRALPRLWPEPPAPELARPWASLLWVLGAMAATLLLSLLHARGLMLVVPGIGGAIAMGFEHLVIFLPILLVPRLLDERETTWLPARRVWARVLIGLTLAELALLGYTAPDGLDAWWAASAGLFDPYNLPYLVRIFCQDVAVAILYVRLRAVMGHGWAIALIAAGFAVAQAPALAGGGFAAESLLRLVVDGGLGAIVLVIAARSADVWWFCWVHFAMDTMQAR